MDEKEEAKKEEELKREVDEFFPNSLPVKVETSTTEGVKETSLPSKVEEPPVEVSTTEGAKKEETLPLVKPIPPVKEEITLEQITKLQTQIENLNKAISSERGEKKYLREELETAKMELEEAKKVAEQDTTDIDPEMEKIMLPILEKRERIKKEKEEENRKKQTEEEAQTLVELWTRNYQEVKAKHSDFDELVRQYFDPAVKYDKELKDKLFSSDNPAEFAYQEAIKIKEKLLKPEIDAAVKKTKEEILTELNKSGRSLPISLSGIPGGSPQGGGTLNPLQKEISEL